jgi:protein SCO1/2
MLSKRSLLAMALGGMAAACAPKPARESKGDIGGPFRLVDQNGRAVDETILRGKWTAIFFGFTYCPDVCPTTLQALAEAKKKLGRKAGDFQVVLFSVDPERDTPQQLNAYLANPVFPEGVIGLTGTPEQVAAAAKVYRVYYKKVGSGEDYTVDHVSYTYLMDPEGRFDRVIGPGTLPDDIARIVTDAMSGRA